MTRLNTWSTAAKWSQWSQGQWCNFTHRMACYDCYWWLFYTKVPFFIQKCILEKKKHLNTGVLLKLKIKAAIINICILTWRQITASIWKVSFGEKNCRELSLNTAVALICTKIYSLFWLIVLVFWLAALLFWFTSTLMNIIFRSSRHLYSTK